MGATSEERMARIHELELLRQEAIHKTETITRDEEARLLQLQVLAVRDENADLEFAISERDFQINAIIEKMEQLQLELEDGKQTIRNQDAQLKKRGIDMASLKAEIEAFNVSVGDSGKLLQEKFALTRELERVKPEMEHLQSQLATYQATVAEKNDLRRRLDAVEAELESEKRSRQRLQSRNNDAATAELTSRLEEAEEKLAAEREERNKIKKELEKYVATSKAQNERLEDAEGKLAAEKEERKKIKKELERHVASTKTQTERLEDAEAKLAASDEEHNKMKKQLERQVATTKAENERLEERISSLKDKAKGLQADLKEARENLHEAQSELSAAQSRTMSRGEKEKPTRKTITSTTDDTKKRRGPVMSFEDITIQTPGNEAVARERPNRKRGPEKVTATVGDKSVFSVTPFLNRAKSLTDDSANESSKNTSTELADPEPAPSDAPAAPEPLSESDTGTPLPKVSFKSAVSFKSPTTKAAKSRPVRKAKPTPTPLGDSTPTKANRVVKSRGTPKIKSIPEIHVDNKKTSARSASPLDQENVPVPVVSSKKAASTLQPKMPEGDVKKRKRKLLGGVNSTILEGGDGDGGEDDVEALAVSRPQPVVAKRARARLGGGVRNAFATGSSFSPLKRDRRGVNASFLA
ncbi:hypothetical protein E4U30_000088 [Claviceps sp. LM220 group G6]|nr:hypothetical protein E4U15_004630 [Claviceps sp. LM218 group G6]KAG6102080.1 hypothetical protein E4U30_000088 [Claviceps sp. LM220 group G6]